MYFMFSGEGATDLGECMPGPVVAEGDHFLHGPMTLLASQIVENKHGYSPVEAGYCGFVSEHQISLRGAELKAAKKSMRLSGIKQPKETRYFFNTARLVARFASEKSAVLGDEVVGVLFRDSDGTASADRGEWEAKRQSMLNGFAEEGFARGVPMIPKPKSEAWIICALHENPYQGCTELEERSGNDNSPNNLKDELLELLGEPVTRQKLCELINQRAVDFIKIEMPSFKVFRNRLEEVI
jgi:hypothetical protein